VRTGAVLTFIPPEIMRLSRPAILAAAVGFLALHAIGAEPAPRWRATAAPLRRPLPAVEVELGYPGPYASTYSSPIELRARSTVPFDGYIGFRFGVGRAMAKDIPVFARTVLGANSAWSFRTDADLRRGETAALMQRELIIEWRNRALEVIARQNVGRPPWSEQRPLRIVGSRETFPASLRYIGREAVAIRDRDIAPRAQWYAGFREIVTPIEVWLDLPAATREAIFHAGNRLVLFGAPRADQSFTALDEAIIPVRFEAGNQAWHPATDAEFAGTRDNPAMAAGHATYIASEETLRGPMPGMRPRVELRFRRTSQWEEDPLSFDALRRIPRTALPAAAALLSTIALWIVMLRRNDLRLAIPAFAIAAALIVAHVRMRPAAGKYLAENRMPITAGIVRHQWDEHVYGPAPIAEEAVTPAAFASFISNRQGIDEEAEIRGPQTPIGHGTMVFTQLPWDSTRRDRTRVELEEKATAVRLSDMREDSLTCEYDLPSPAQTVMAVWFRRGVQHVGRAALPHPRNGRITIRELKRLPGIGGWLNDLPRHAGRDAALLTFEAADVRGARRMRWMAEAPSIAPFSPYFIRGELEDDNTTSFVLPEAPFPDDGLVIFEISDLQKNGSVTLIGERGSVEMNAPRRPFTWESRWTAPVASVRGITGAHQILRVVVKSMITIQERIVRMKVEAK